VNAFAGNIDKIIMAGVELFVALIKNLPTIIVEIVIRLCAPQRGSAQAKETGVFLKPA